MDTTDIETSALLVIYTFPPTGGAGVQRAVKFSKYLPLNGVDLTVLTVKDIIYHVYDPSLLEDVHSSVKIIRTESLDPLRVGYRIKTFISKRRNTGQKSAAIKQTTIKAKSSLGIGSKFKQIYRYASKWLFFIDATIMWLPFAVSAGCKAVRKSKIRNIVSMSQPNSLILTSYLISKRTGVPLILDMRDPWVDDPYFTPPTRLHRWFYERIEKRAFDHAKKIVVISESMRTSILKRHIDLEGKIHVVPNGFDTDDFPVVEHLDLQNSSPSGKTLITYTGSLYQHHMPAMSLFLQGISEAEKELPGCTKKLKVRVIGNVEGEVRQLIEESPWSQQFDLVGYVSHSEAVAYTSAADVLLMFIKLDLNRDDDTITLPGKLFEYLGSGKRILYLGPSSEAADIINDCRQGWTPDIQPSAVGLSLLNILEQDHTSFEADNVKLSNYDRRAQAHTFAQFLS